MSLGCLRALFEVPDGVAYLDSAAYSLLPTSVRAAGEEGIASKSRAWEVSRGLNAGWIERARTAAAGLIGATPDDVAIVSSVSHGLATIVANVSLPAGSRVLRLQDEHSSIVLALDRLAQTQGVVVEAVPRPEDGDWTRAVREAIERPGAPKLSLAALTPLHWSDGALVDMNALAPLVRAAGTILVIDATQAVGVMDMDVRRLQPDYLMFPTYKWLLGPYSLAFLYVAPRHQSGRGLDDNLGNVPGGTPAIGARRFDKGEVGDPVGLRMGTTGMELVAGWGHQAVSETLAERVDRIAEGAASLGLQVLPKRFRTPHILGVRLQGGAPPDLVDRLAQAEVHVSDRLGVIRISPHVWASEADCDQAIAALRSTIPT
jgi:selenocysteine lyase/cysteine desulfurase